MRTDRFLPASVFALALLGAACGSAPRGTPGPEASALTEPEEKVYRNTVKWSTASEVDNFGFNVYRGESPEGPFVRLNESVVEGGGTTDETRRYRFVDEEIDPHRTYYYYVESISMSGERKRFTPVGKALPKIPAAENPGL